MVGHLADLLEHDAQREIERRQRWQRISELWLAGQTSREIAAELGLPYAHVRAAITHLRHRGVDLPRRRGIEHNAPVAQRAAELLRAGLSQRQVAAELGISYSGARGAIARARAKGFL